MTEPSTPGWVEPSTAGAAGTSLHIPPDCGAGATRTLHRSLRAPAEARRFVDEQICAIHNSPATDAVALVASEVVTHALLRGEGPVSVALQCHVTSSTLSVSCWMGAAQESAGAPGDPASRLILDSICLASGTEQTEHGLTMWCTIPAEATQHEPATR